MSELLNYMIEASIYASLTYLTFLWLRKHSSYFAQRAWLLSGLVLSLCVPFIDFGVIANNHLYNWQLPVIYLDGSMQGSPVNEKAFHWSQIIIWTYFAGLFVAGMKLASGFVPIINWLIKGERKEIDDLEFIFHKQVQVPFSFGPYIFWNPAWEYSDAQREMILLHESAHIQKKHTWDLLFLQLLKVMAWFHPLVYLYESAIKDIHEFEADQATLTDYKKKDYIELLLQHLFRARWVLGHSIFQSPIQKRIKMMKSNNKHTTNKRMMALGLMFMFSCILYLGCSETAVQSTDSASQEYMISEKENTEMAISDEVFQKVEEMPRFPGCDDVTDEAEVAQCSQTKMINWIMSRINYPEDAKMNNATGKVVVKFVVDKEGKIVEPTLVKDIGYGMGDEVLRVVNLMNEMDERWTPGVQRDRKVNVQLYLPVQFQLSQD